MEPDVRSGPGVPRALTSRAPAPLLIVFGLGVWEVLLVLGLVVLLFGAKRIPQIARGLGSGIRNFKGELKDPQDDHTPGDGDGPSR
jgi:sec-independent protein translocase protein TatA